MVATRVSVSMSDSGGARWAVLSYYLFRVTDSVGFIWPVFTLFLLWNDLTFTQIGTLSAISAVLVVVFEVPTGYDDVDEQLREIQNHLHIVQADFANPEPDADDPQVDEGHVAAVEAMIDGYDDELDPLESFILPSGSETGSRLHHARAVCRRAERRAVSFAAQESANETAVVYLNRLSDTLFTLARVVNKRDGVPEENPTY